MEGERPALRKSTRLQRFLRNNFSPVVLYPFKGIWYFTTHRYLHPLLQSRLIPLTLLSTCVLAILFLTLYVPVVAFLALFHYKGSAWTNATFFILGIGSLLIALLFEALFVDHTQVDIFDAVLVAEGYENLVRNRRPIGDNIEEADPYRRLGIREKGATYAPFSLRQIIEFIILLPLNFIPFAGVPLFLLATGYRAGPFLNWRYFALKGFDKKQRNDFIKTKKRKWEYMWFGAVHMLLQLIPVLSMFFLLTIAVGSALWSVHLEEEPQRGQPIPQEEDLPQTYSDDFEDDVV
ncbi:uncharacterized protein K489DRAFT_391488 [Dissoconium aciculare CBS 342.82]|uniref:Uncharacterized protein n=1 Tax=Dissoconium aciculare CBS 342.82 TaxID=1314786 RepID=A0A6J3LRI3_9PEZI|nr:uncharacterized protein K489DRAFT_391488 [Dissoconium aciculare CBS 342.82]KAF1817889.1 hypothetical protein K489DRAFT_391488 [Dissoconium aciculare CBS 342.82]